MYIREQHPHCVQYARELKVFELQQNCMYALTVIIFKLVYT